MFDGDDDLQKNQDTRRSDAEEPKSWGGEEEFKIAGDESKVKAK